MEKVLRWIGMVGHTDQRPSAWRIQISECLPSFLVQVHENSITNRRRDPAGKGRECTFSPMTNGIVPNDIKSTDDVQNVIHHTDARTNRTIFSDVERSGMMPGCRRRRHHSLGMSGCVSHSYFSALVSSMVTLDSVS